MLLWRYPGASGNMQASYIEIQMLQLEYSSATLVIQLICYSGGTEGLHQKKNGKIGNGSAKRSGYICCGNPCPKAYNSASNATTPSGTLEYWMKSIVGPRHVVAACLAQPLYAIFGVLKTEEKQKKKKFL